MFTFASPPVVALAWLGGLLVFYLVAVLLFRAGCALADVTDPPLGKALFVVGAALALCLPGSGGVGGAGAGRAARPRPRAPASSLGRGGPPRPRPDRAARPVARPGRH